jgi:MFS family permease
LSRYGEILRTPQVTPLVASSLLSRLPIGINALALVLFLSEKTGSFAVAGTVAGSLAAGSGVGAAFAGRLVDRLGARRVLVPLACIHAASLGAIVASAYAGLPAALMVAFGVLAGAATPPTSSVMRSLWTDLLPPPLHQAAYALDSTLIELIFITGPLLTAALTALFSPAAALVVSPVAAIGGTALFTALPAAHGLEPHPDAHAAGPLGALASPGVRTLILISVPAGIGIGILEVGIPGFCRIEGVPAAAGVLLAVWSFGSGVGGLAYGLLPRRAGLDRTHLLFAALLPLTFLAPAAAPSVAAMALLVIPAGCMIAPLLATRNELVARVAPENARTEAYTWPVTAFVAGIAIGSALAGVLVEGPGWRTAFVVAAAIGFSGFLLAVARRKTLGRTTVRVRTL